jgi:6-pyruvoyltetrahydropterin/6-carboxytetrahydropterin synthase
MTHTITVRHAFDAAHRLPNLGGKCRSLHGHTWRTAITLASPTLDHDGLVVDCTDFKRAARAWIDSRLDHATMLGVHDPLIQPLRNNHCRIFVFGDDWDGAQWPTVEAVAMLIGEQAQGWLKQMKPLPDTVLVTGVLVQETSTNSAEWNLP